MPFRPSALKLRVERNYVNSVKVNNRAYEYQLFICGSSHESADAWLLAATATNHTVNNDSELQLQSQILKQSFTTTTSSNNDRVRKSSILRQSPPPVIQEGIHEALLLSPTSPTEKKNVRFADSMGYELESIKYFVISPQVRHRQCVTQSSISPIMYNLYNNNTDNNSQKCSLVPTNFTIPSLQSNFWHKLTSQSVLTHSITTSETTVYGIVSVINHCFIKKVYVRYTFNDWRSYAEQEGYYMLGSHENESDKFTFAIYCKPTDFKLTEPNLFHPRLFFCIRYVTGSNGGVEYWDNNDGKNYCLNYIAL